MKIFIYWWLGLFIGEANARYCPAGCTSCGNANAADGSIRVGFYDCSGSNLIKEVPFGLPKDEIIELRLGNCRIDKILQLDFNGWKGLEKLYVEGNNMTEVEPGAFRELVDMTTLDLSNNLIKSFPEGLFSPMVKLERLHLDNNQIEVVPNDFTFMHSLQYLTMKNNQIKSITWWKFQPIETTLLRLMIYQPSLNCTCNNYELKSWIKQTKESRTGEDQEPFIDDSNFICRGTEPKNCSEPDITSVGHVRDMAKIYSTEYADMYTTGQNATLYCNMTGDPVPRIHWTSSNGVDAWDIDDQVDEYGRLHLTNLQK